MSSMYLSMLSTHTSSTLFPYTTLFRSVFTDTTLTRIMGEIAQQSPFVKRQYGIGGQRPKTHGRDIKHRHVIGLCAVGPPHRKGKGKCLDLRPGPWVVNPLIGGGIKGGVGCKGPVVRFLVGPDINQWREH